MGFISLGAHGEKVFFGFYIYIFIIFLKNAFFLNYKSFWTWFLIRTKKIKDRFLNKVDDLISRVNTTTSNLLRPSAKSRGRINSSSLSRPATSKSTRIGASFGTNFDQNHGTLIKKPCLLNIQGISMLPNNEKCKPTHPGTFQNAFEPKNTFQSSFVKKSFDIWDSKFHDRIRNPFNRPKISSRGAGGAQQQECGFERDEQHLKMASRLNSVRSSRTAATSASQDKKYQFESRYRSSIPSGNNSRRIFNNNCRIIVSGKNFITN